MWCLSVFYRGWYENNRIQFAGTTVSGNMYGYVLR